MPHTATKLRKVFKLITHDMETPMSTLDIRSVILQYREFRLRLYSAVADVINEIEAMPLAEHDEMIIERAEFHRLANIEYVMKEMIRMGMITQDQYEIAQGWDL